MAVPAKPTTGPFDSPLRLMGPGKVTKQWWVEYNDCDGDRITLTCRLTEEQARLIASAPTSPAVSPNWNGRTRD